MQNIDSVSTLFGGHCMCPSRVFIVHLCVCLAIATSCNTNKEHVDGYNYVDSVTLKEVREITFPVDSVTSNNTLSLQFFVQRQEDNDKEFLAYFNKKPAQISFFNYETKALDFKIDLQRQGPNGVGSASAFYVHNFDSIFVLNMYGYRVALIDSSGVVKQRYKLITGELDMKTGMPKTRGAITSLPYAFTFRPIVYDNGKLFVGGLPDRNPLDRKYYDSNELMIELDLKRKTYEYLYSYPDSYDAGSGIWGMHLAMFYYTYNSDANSFVFSFPVDNYIYQTDFKGRDNKYYAGSQLISEISSWYNSDKVDIIKETNYYLTTPSYNAIYYDKYRKCYYRFAKQAIDEEDIATLDENLRYASAPDQKPTSIIILDVNFNVIGESIIDNVKFRSDMSFITPEGLHIAKPDFENENMLRFGVFELINKE